MSGGRSGDHELSNDAVGLLVLGVIAAGVIFAKRDHIFATVGDWLRAHRVLTDEDPMVTIPHVGGLDLARVVILVGVLVVAAVVSKVLRRRNRQPSERG